MRQRRLSTTLKNLALALLNATLILVAICLWLAWQLSNTIGSAATQFSSNISLMEPVRADIQGFTSEIGGLRSDIATLSVSDDASASVAVERIRLRLDSLEARLDGTGQRIEEIAEKPEILIDRAVDRAALQIKGTINEIIDCKGAGEIAAGLPPATN